MKGIGNSIEIMLKYEVLSIGDESMRQGLLWGVTVMHVRARSRLAWGGCLGGNHSAACEARPPLFWEL